MDAKHLQRLAALAIALAAMALHWPPATTDFNVDDHGFIVENETLRDLSAATQALLRSFPPAENDRSLYRPLTNFGHALEWRWFGLDSRSYHVVNSVLYGVVCALVFGLLRWYRLGLAASFGAAALFAFHPVHSEAVDAIAGRSELLSLAFSLTALLAFARALFPSGSSEPREVLHGGWFTLSNLALVGALLSKETGAITAVLMLMQLGIAQLASPARATWRRVAADGIPILLILFAWSVLRTFVLGRFSPVLDTRLFEFAGTSERLYTMFSIYLEYLRLLFWPQVLQPDFYYVRAVGVAREIDGRVAAGVFFALASSMATLGIGRRVLRDVRVGIFDARSPRVAGLFGALTFFAYLAPVSHVVDVGALMAERFLFAPSLGIALIAGSLLSIAFGDTSVRPRRIATASLLTVLCIAGGARTAARADEWRTAHGLWSAYTEVAPDDGIGWSSLGAVQMSRGELAEARISLERALDLEPSGYSQELNLAALLVHEKRYAEAIEAYQAMLDSRPRVDQRVWIGLAKLHVRAGRLDKARKDALRALGLHPNFAETHRLIEKIDELKAKRGGN